MHAVLVFWLLLGAVSSGFAQQPAGSAPPAARPIKILFVGNSFTHGKYLPVRTYNAAAVNDENFGLPSNDPRAHSAVDGASPYGGIPGIFKKLTDEAGLNYEVHVEAVSAKDLAFHYEHALSVIARPDWDAVVLQGYSTESLPVERGGKPKKFRDSALLLEKAIHTANHKAKVYIEQTWPRADLIYPENAPYHDASIDRMVIDLRDACRALPMSDMSDPSKTLPVRGFEPFGAEVGDAWEAAMDEGVAVKNPYQPAEPGKLDLWGPDHYHPSIYGAYLSAVILVSDIALESSSKLQPDEQAAHDLGISPADVMRLQQFGAVIFTYGPGFGSKQ